MFAISTNNSYSSYQVYNLTVNVSYNEFDIIMKPNDITTMYGNSDDDRNLKTDENCIKTKAYLVHNLYEFVCPIPELVRHKKYEKSSY